MTLRSFRAMARWVPILCAPGFAACYTYLPAEVGGPQRGVQIRAQVQNHPTFQVGDRTIHDVTRVDGEVIRWEPDTLALSATGLQSFEQGYPGSGYTVRLPVGDIASLTTRRLDKGRTILLALGAAAVAVIAQQTLGGGAQTSDNPPGGGASH